jgi:hypothetical protein
LSSNGANNHIVPEYAGATNRWGIIIDGETNNLRMVQTKGGDLTVELGNLMLYVRTSRFASHQFNLEPQLSARPIGALREGCIWNAHRYEAIQI